MVFVGREATSCLVPTGAKVHCKRHRNMSNKFTKCWDPVWGSCDAYAWCAQHGMRRSSVGAGLITGEVEGDSIELHAPLPPRIPTAHVISNAHNPHVV